MLWIVVISVHKDISGMNISVIKSDFIEHVHIVWNLRTEVGVKGEGKMNNFS